ncbi:trigger factor [Actinomyces minihominis]|uniref:trigger factor n=1 Tax=Actinomyces minihominis TaxID=2002838 RepID=UPI000C085F43|nr:trigger factor [Actinomyces minihominis]
MKSTVEYLEPTKARLTVTVDYDELKPFMAEAYKEIAGQVNIPGFRKGNVPPRIIDQRFGRGAVIEQVVNQVVPEQLNNAIVENKLRPLAQPEIEVDEIPATEGEPGGALVFSANMDVVPAFELPSLEGRTVEVDLIDVTDEDVQAELDSLRGRFATLKNLDRPAEDGDFLTLDLKATVGDEEIDSLSDVSYELGSGSMLPGQDEALRGASAGEEITFNSSVAGGDHAGSEAVIDVKVTAVKERELPEVDDDFALMVSEFDTAEELREDTVKTVREGKKGSQALQARDRLLEQLIAEAEILLPEDVVEAEVARRVSEDADEEARAEVRERIVADIRQQVFLDTLVEGREVEVAQQELIDFMMHTAQTYGMDLGTMLQDQTQIQNLYAELARTKALVSVLGETTVKDTNGEVVDLSAFTADGSKAEEPEVVEEEGTFAIDIEDIADEDEEN